MVGSSWDTFADDLKAGGGAVTRGGQSQRTGSASTVKPGSLYAVRVHTFEGADRLKNAHAFAGKLRSDVQVPDVWTTEVDGVTTVYVGKYARPNHPDAETTLGRLHAAEFDGFDLKTAAIEQVSVVNEGSADPLDLRNYPGMRTLQVGFYDDAVPDRRKAAELWARQLRSEEVEAYYHHGPHRSAVTVGLFSASDFVEQVNPSGARVEAYGPRIRELQKKFPHNLGNGSTIEESQAGKAVGTQPSFIVQVR